MSAEPQWFPLIGRALRTGPAHPPVCGWAFSQSLPQTTPGEPEGIVAAGVTPAASPTSGRKVMSAEPQWFPLIGRALRTGPAHPPVCGWAFSQSLPQTTPGEPEGIVAAGVTPAASPTSGRKVMSAEPQWFPLIGRALRTGPAHPPVCGWAFSQSLPQTTPGEPEGIVAAGVTPAASPTSGRKVMSAEPQWFPLIGRALRTGPAHPPVCGWAFSQSLPQTTPGEPEGIVAAGVTPAASPTSGQIRLRSGWLTRSSSSNPTPPTASRPALASGAGCRQSVTGR